MRGYPWSTGWPTPGGGPGRCPPSWPPWPSRSCWWPSGWSSPSPGGRCAGWPTRRASPPCPWRPWRGRTMSPTPWPATVLWTTPTSPGRTATSCPPSGRWSRRASGRRTDSGSGWRSCGSTCPPPCPACPGPWPKSCWTGPWRWTTTSGGRRRRPPPGRSVTPRRPASWPRPAVRRGASRPRRPPPGTRRCWCGTPATGT